MIQHAPGRYEIAAQEDRSAIRHKLTIPAQLRQSGGRGFHTVVHDLSLSGFSATAVFSVSVFSILVTSGDLVVFRFKFELYLLRTAGGLIQFANYPAIRRLRTRSASASCGASPQNFSKA